MIHGLWDPVFKGMTKLWRKINMGWKILNKQLEKTLEEPPEKILELILEKILSDWRRY